MTPVAVADDSELWDVLSVRDDAGEPRLGNCQLHVGDHVLDFKNGVAKAPESLLPTLLLDKRLRIPGYRGGVPRSAAPSNAADVERPSEEDLAAVLAEDNAALGGTGTTAPVAGREPLTKDGQPRCQAVKADGSQCENSAVDGNACGLGAHKSQLS